MSLRDTVDSCSDTCCGVKVLRHAYELMASTVVPEIFYMLFDVEGVNQAFQLINPLENVIPDEDTAVVTSVKESVLRSLC